MLEKALVLVSVTGSSIRGAAVGAGYRPTPAYANPRALMCSGS